MRNYLVTYERTDHEDHNYNPFLNFLQQAQIGSFHAVWIIQSTYPCGTLFEYLYGLLAKEDRLVVCDLSVHCSRRINVPGEEPLKVL